VPGDETFEFGRRDLRLAADDHVLGPVDVAQVLPVVAGDLEDDAFQDGDEIVVDGFFQGCPEPDPKTDAGPSGPKERMFRFLAQDIMQTRLHRWRMNLVTGATSEQDLSDSYTEFGTINSWFGGRPYRYNYAATNEPGWFLFNGLVKHDTLTGREERYQFEPGVFCSEVGVAPRVGGPRRMTRIS
jgi:carotenoid cleavage dioxygenase-like enzyme